MRTSLRMGHYERLTKGLADEVLRSGWVVVAFCWMPNHLHLLLKTPQPNLSSGMQHWLSGYANWYAKRNQRTGHLFQGRYKSFAGEDASYYWTLSPDSAANLVRRANKQIVSSPKYKQQFEALREKLLKTEYQV